MKSYRKELTFHLPKRIGFVNVTPEVEAAVRESGVAEGLCLVNPMHITASVFVNDDERGLLADFERFFEALVPHEPVRSWRHNDTGEENADAHVKRQLMGREAVLAITGGTARPRPLGAGLLRRVGRAAAEAGPRQDHRGVSARPQAAPSAVPPLDRRGPSR